MQIRFLYDPSKLASSKLVSSKLVAITCRRSYTPFRLSASRRSSLFRGYQPRKGDLRLSPLPRTRLSFPAYLQETCRLIKSARSVPYGSSPLEGDAIYRIKLRHRDGSVTVLPVGKISYHCPEFRIVAATPRSCVYFYVAPSVERV